MTLLLDELRIGLALVVERTETVHGHTLQQHKERLQLTELCAGPYDYPVYNYSLEGGFCSWTRHQTTIYSSLTFSLLFICFVGFFIQFSCCSVSTSTFLEPHHVSIQLFSCCCSVSTLTFLEPHHVSIQLFSCCSVSTLDVCLSCTLVPVHCHDFSTLLQPSTLE